MGPYCFITELTYVSQMSMVDLVDQICITTFYPYKQTLGVSLGLLRLVERTYQTETHMKVSLNSLIIKQSYLEFNNYTLISSDIKYV